MGKPTIFLAIAFLSIQYMNVLKAQDIHHSQFYTSHLNYNPAATGLFSGDQRIAVNYRRQWFVDDIVRYMTFSGTYDCKIYPKRWTQKGIFNAGIQFNYDQAGDSKLGLAHLGVTLSYSYPLSTQNILSGGLGMAFAHRRFKPDELIWESQYNGIGFDPSLPSGENFGNTSNNFFDAQAGLNYRWQKSARTHIDFGVSAFHLTQPDQKFFNQSLTIRLPIRWSLQLLPSFKISNNLDLQFHGLFQKQLSYTETLLGGYAKIYLNQHRGSELSLSLGIATRIEDSLIPKISLQYRNFMGGISYDITQSDFSDAVRNRGGPEFSFVYVYTKARPLSQLKSCPIF